VIDLVQHLVVYEMNLCLLLCRLTNRIIPHKHLNRTRIYIRISEVVVHPSLTLQSLTLGPTARPNKSFIRISCS